MTRTFLAVDPIACEGHGLCAELLPEMITLDEWGYPIVGPHPLDRRLESLAKRAVAACPTLALLLRQADDRDPRNRPPTRNAGGVRPGTPPAAANPPR